jgi:adhesin transport system membrane fusion protein
MIYGKHSFITLIKKKLEFFFIKISRTQIFQVSKCLPIIKYVWYRIESFAIWAFDLTDHSSLRATRILFRSLIIFLIIFFFWASIFRIDQVVRAQAQVVASSHTQVVQAAEGGVIAEMKVREGDPVKIGQIIAVLSKERAQASFSEIFGKVVALRMTITRLQAEIDSKPLVYDESLRISHPDLYKTQINLYTQRRLALDDQLIILKDNVKLSQQELDLNLPLEKMGDISKVDILRLKRTLNEARNQYTSVKNKYLQDAISELSKAQEDLNSQEQIMADRQQLLAYTDIVSPATGIVKNIKITTPGGVVRQGEEILEILPTESNLVVEAKVKPADMANIKVGLPAKVKLDSYDYAIFGTMSGTITYVSADSLKEDSKQGPVVFYRVKVAIIERDSKAKQKELDIEVRPGMTATVDIQTGKRSVISYLTKPLIRTVQEAFGER